MDNALKVPGHALGTSRLGNRYDRKETDQCWDTQGGDPERNSYALNLLTQAGESPLVWIIWQSTDLACEMRQESGILMAFVMPRSKPLV